jgi:hypothetical protein
MLLCVKVLAVHQWTRTMKANPGPSVVVLMYNQGEWSGFLHNVVWLALVRTTQRTQVVLVLRALS